MLSIFPITVLHILMIVVLNSCCENSKISVIYVSRAIASFIYSVAFLPFSRSYSSLKARHDVSGLKKKTKTKSDLTSL